MYTHFVWWSPTTTPTPQIKRIKTKKFPDLACSASPKFRNLHIYIYELTVFCFYLFVLVIVCVIERNSMLLCACVAYMFLFSINFYQVM